jgi:hypothetical protein
VFDHVANGEGFDRLSPTLTTRDELQYACKKLHVEQVSIVFVHAGAGWLRIGCPRDQGDIQCDMGNINPGPDANDTNTVMYEFDSGVFLLLNKMCAISNNKSAIQIHVGERFTVTTELCFGGTVTMALVPISKMHTSPDHIATTRTVVPGDTEDIDDGDTVNGAGVDTEVVERTTTTTSPSASSPSLISSTAVHPLPSNPTTPVATVPTL